MSPYNYIGQASYKGEIVFYSASCCATYNWALASYDCSGNRIEGDYSLDYLDNKKMIWKAQDSEGIFDE